MSSARDPLPPVNYEQQKHFVRLASSREEKDKIQAAELLSVLPTSFKPEVALHHLANLLKDSSHQVKFAAVSVAAVVVYFIVEYSNDTSEIESALKGLTSDDKIFHEVPTVPITGGRPDKISLLAATALCNIYQRTKSPVEYRKFSRHYYWLSKSMLRQTGGESEYFALRLLILSLPAVSTEEGLLSLENILHRDLQDAATIVIACGRAQEYALGEGLSSESRNMLEQITESSTKFLLHPVPRVRAAVKQMREIIKSNLNSKVGEIP